MCRGRCGNKIWSDGYWFNYSLIKFIYFISI
jgi:hypothetical protein